MRENNSQKRRRNRLRHFPPADSDAAALQALLQKEEQQPSDAMSEADNHDTRPSPDAVSGRRMAEKGRRKINNNRGRKLKISLIIFLVLVLVLATGTTTAAYYVSHGETVFPNVFLGEVYVGGMNRQQVQEALEVSGWEQVSAAPLEVLLMDTVSFTIDSRQAGTRFPLEQAVEAAYSYGHTPNWFLNLAEYLRCMLRPVDVSDYGLQENREYVLREIDAAIETLDQELGDGSYQVSQEDSMLRMIKGAGQLSFDTADFAEAVYAALRSNQTQLFYRTLTKEPSAPDFRKIHEELAAEPVDASFSDDNRFTVIDHVVGCSFDVEAAKEIWDKAESAALVEIPLKITYPKITSEYLNSLLFRDKLGAMVTYYKNSIDNRINNLNLAAEKINGLILYPGDVFSYNETIGKRTQEAGFLPAGAYENGEVVEEVGGGICQVSSTLYSAMLYGYKLTTVERSPHYFPVDYLEKGYDATVSWPKPDFKFRNDRDYPIKIVAVCDNQERALTVEIWGTNLDGYFINLKKETRAYNNAKYPWIMEGYGVQVFRYVMDANGMQVGQVNEIYDVYHTHEATEQIKALDEQAALQAAMGETAVPQ